MIEIILKKRCSKCGLEKPRDEFHKDKRNTDGLRSDCKVCRAAQQKAYHKSYYESNKDKVKAYREANKEEIKAREKAWREANKDKIKAHNKAYYEANKDYYKAYHKAWQNKRLKEDPIHKLKADMRGRVYQLLKGQKSKRTEEIIGLSWADTEKELYALFRWENLQGMEHNENIEKGNRFCNKKRADQVAKNHPDTDLIKQILSRQTKTKTQYIKE